MADFLIKYFFFEGCIEKVNFPSSQKRGHFYKGLELYQGLAIDIIAKFRQRFWFEVFISFFFVPSKINCYLKK